MQGTQMEENNCTVNTHTHTCLPGFCTVVWENGECFKTILTITQVQMCRCTATETQCHGHCAKQEL